MYDKCNDKGIIDVYYLFCRYSGERYQWYHPQHFKVGRYHGFYQEESTWSPKDKLYLFLIINFSINIIYYRDISFTFTLLPSSLTHLTFGINFNLPFNDSLLSLPLTHLIFHQYSIFNHPIAHALPSTLLHLTFGMDFNQILAHLPPSLTHLTCGQQFNDCIDEIPPSITHLSVGATRGGVFNIPVSRLPPCLVSLDLGDKYCFSLPRLPATLTHLNLGVTFPVLPDLPLAITHLTLNSYYMDNVLLEVQTIFPSSLIYFFTVTLAEKMILPPTLHSLAVGYQIQGNAPFPPKLKYLEVMDLRREKDLFVPDSLETLILFGDWKYVLHSLPPNLTRLEIFNYGTLPFPLPPSIAHLHLSVRAEIKPEDTVSIFYLPNLTYLSLNFVELYDKFTVPSISLPPELTTLKLSTTVDTYDPYTHLNFTHLISIIDFFSAPLKTLYINGPSAIPALPSSLHTLKLSHFTSCSPLPLQLEKLTINLKQANLTALPSFPPRLQILKLNYKPREGEYMPEVPQSLKQVVARKFVVKRNWRVPPGLTKLLAMDCEDESELKYPETLEDVNYSK